MSKYTKGPWNVWGETKLCIRAEKRIVACTSQESMADWETAKANARLIAAAPELLEALEFIVSSDGTGYVDGHGFIDIVEIAEKAIAKAKGE